MNQAIKKCCWVLKPATPGTLAEYCGKPTKYKIVQGQRDYDTLCPHHRDVDDAAKKQEEQADDCEAIDRQTL